MAPDDAYTIAAPATSADGVARERDPLPPDTLVGRYRIVRRIGKGGMGEVLVAFDAQIKREVAIKRMRTTSPSERQVRRFLREASVQGRLEHPAIVPVHEIGTDEDGLPFFAMKRLTGRSLAEIIGARATGEAIPLQRVLRAFADLCLAVEFAHVRGVVHRDLKPDNVVVGDYGEVYVLDWGVAKIVQSDDDDDDDLGAFADVSGSGEHATIAGTAVGTPGYMSPEQARGAGDVDGRADVYTLGCLLFEILCAEPLHPSGQDGIASALAGVDARPSTRTDDPIAPELDALCVAATALDRAQRIASARELADRVLAYLDGDRDVATRRALAGEHLARAHAAFVDRDQRGAVRDAAAALALDPTLAGAAELVGRLMLEPPAITPPEVEAELAADDARAARATAHAGVWAVISTLAFTPLMWWIAPSGSPYLIAFTAFLVVNGACCYAIERAAKPLPGLVVIANTILIAFLARMFSPILIAPGIAAVLAMAMVLTPRFSVLGSAWAITALFAAAILIPWGLERAGILSITMSVARTGVVFHPPLVEGEETRTMIVAAIYAVAVVAGAALLADVMRARARRDAHRLHLQAWQLRQLV